MILAELVVSLCSLPAASTGAPLIVYVDHGFDASTSGWQVDHFDRVQDGVDAVAVGGKVIVSQDPGPVDLFDEAVVIDRRITLEGDGSNWPATIDGGDVDTLTLLADGVTVRGLNLWNTTPVQETVALRIYSRSNSIVDNTLDGSVRSATLEPGADLNLIQGNWFRGAQNGLAIVSDRNVVEDNVFEDHTTGNIVCSGSNNTLRGNTVDGPSSYTGIGVGGTGNRILDNVISRHTKGLTLTDATGTEVLGNAFVDIFYSGIENVGSDGCEIRDNTFDGWGFAAVDLRGDDCVVADNQFGPSSNSQTLYLVGATRATVTGNVLEDGSIFIDVGFASTLEDLPTLTMSGNTSAGRPIVFHKDVVGPFTVAPGAAQVFLANCSDVTISGQELVDPYQGIVVSHCSDVAIEDNSIAGARYGIVLYETTQSELAGNLVTDCLTGISSRYGGDNLVTSNLFAANTTPIEEYWCPTTPNTVFHNAFVGTQTLEGDCGDAWDGGPGVGGNFYDDYDGVDLDGDGFGDTPRVIGKVVDNYPLMVPDGAGVLWSDALVLSTVASDVYSLRLEAGSPNGGRPYVLLAGISGSSPGTPLPGGAVLPLNADALTSIVLAGLGTPMFTDFAGNLAADGSATALLVLGPLGSGLVGIEVTFAYGLIDTFDFVSAPFVMTAGG